MDNGREQVDQQHKENLPLKKVLPPENLIDMIEECRKDKEIFLKEIQKVLMESLTT